MEMLELLRKRKTELVGRLNEAKAAGLKWLRDEVLVRLSELDVALAEFPESAPPEPASEPPRPAAPPVQRRGPVLPSPVPARRTRKRQASSAASPVKSARRSASTLSELIDPRVMAVLVKHGSISPKDITSILDRKLLGPVMSGWKRGCTRLGADLDVLLVKDKAASGEDIYRLTDKGRDVLVPDADALQQPPVAPAGAGMPTLPAAVVGSPVPAPAV